MPVVVQGVREGGGCDDGEGRRGLVMGTGTYDGVGKGAALGADADGVGGVFNVGACYYHAGG